MSLTGLNKFKIGKGNHKPRHLNGRFPIYADEYNDLIDALDNLFEELHPGLQTSILGLSDTSSTAIANGILRWNPLASNIEYVTTLPSSIITGLSLVATSGSYNDLSGVPTLVSSFTNDVGYLTSFTETDPVFTASAAAGIVAGDITNWNTAFGWGNHALAGYLVNGDVDLSYTASTRTIGNTAGDDAVLPLFTATEAGLVPLSGGGTTNFLRADGTWAAAGADGNGIFDASNDGGTVPANFNVSLTDNFTFDNGSVNLLGQIGVGTNAISSPSFGIVPIHTSKSIASDEVMNSVQNTSSTGLAGWYIHQDGSTPGTSGNDRMWMRAGGTTSTNISWGNRLEIGQQSTGGISFSNYVGGDMHWYIKTTGGSQTTIDRRMLLNTTGLAIGEGLTPTSKLHVGGDTRVDGTLQVNNGANLVYFSGSTGDVRIGGTTIDAIGASVPTLQISNGSGQGGVTCGDHTSATIRMWANSTSLNWGGRSNHDIDVWTNNLQRGFFKADGQLLWGTSSRTSTTSEIFELVGRQAFVDTTSPTATAGTCKIYAKDVNGTSKLFVMDGAGVETQLN